MPVRGSVRTRIALIILAAALVYFAGNGSVSLFDRDEPRFAQCSREMLQSGDWVVPRLYGQVRTAKPPFIYWCQAAAMRVLDENAFAARLPSALAMPVTLALVAAFVRRVAGPRRAFWTVLVLATSAMVLISAKASLTDSVLLLCVTVAQFCVYAVWRGRGTWPVVLALAVAVGVAGLTKGPVVLGVLAMTLPALALLGRGIRPRGTGTRLGTLSALKALLAIGVAAAIAGPWMYLVEQRSPGFLAASLFHDVVRRTTTGLEQHGGPPGYHLVTIWAFLLPWSPLLPLAIVNAWKHRHLPLVRFSLAAALGPWLMFEFVQTKLPHYMLPTYPFLAILVGDAIVRCLRGELRDLDTTPFRVAVGAVGVVVAGFAIVPAAVESRFVEDPLWPAVVLAAAGWVAANVLGALLVWPNQAQRRRRLVPGLLTLGLGTLAMWAVAWTVFFPRAPFLRLSIRAADVLRTEGATGPGRAEMLDYKEPTLAFYQGGTIRENPHRELTHAVLDEAAPWLVITDDLWQRAPVDVRDRLTVYARFKGIAYADQGRWVEVLVVRKAGSAGER
jgi:4-amino-4-deoxy-L-arabinose transferase-like glycosyltransferase